MSNETECIVCEVGTAYEADNDSGINTDEYEKPINKALDTIKGIGFGLSVSGMHWIEYECEDCKAVFRSVYGSFEGVQQIKPKV